MLSFGDENIGMCNTFKVETAQTGNLRASNAVKISDPDYSKLFDRDLISSPVCQVPARSEVHIAFAAATEKEKNTKKMFYIIGLGLCDEKDITLRGLEVRTCYYSFSTSVTDFESPDRP